MESINVFLTESLKTVTKIFHFQPLHRSYWASDNVGYIVEWSLLNSSNSSQQSVTLGDSTVSSYILQVSDGLKTKNECVNFYSVSDAIGTSLLTKTVHFLFEFRFKFVHLMIRAEVQLLDPLTLRLMYKRAFLV